MSGSAGARSVLGTMTNLRVGPDTGLLRPSLKTHVTGGQSFSKSSSRQLLWLSDQYKVLRRQRHWNQTHTNTKKNLWACDIEFRIRFWIWTFSRDETSSSGSWSWDARGAVKISWNKKSEEFASKLQIHHWPRMMIAIFEQVRKYLLEEVNIVYECKVCMNFFRWILLLIVLFLFG